MDSALTKFKQSSCRIAGFSFTFACHMKNAGLILFLLLCSMIPYTMEAQQSVWIEGEVLTADSLLPLKNVHIISRMNRRGTISDADGKFVLHGKTKDTVMFSAIGFHRTIMPFDSSLTENDNRWKVLLRKDTILMEEVVVRSFYDWPTFKQLFVTMKPITLPRLENINDELRDILLYMDPAPLTIKGPIQALYDLFNDAARLQRRLQRNRRLYNQQLIKEGRYDELIPETLDHQDQ